MKLRRCLAIMLLLLSLVLSVNATQQEDGVAAVKTVDGMILVWNRTPLHFTLEVKGKDVRPLNSTEHVFLSVDGMVFQVQSVAIKEFMKEAATKKQDDKSILLAHRDWEAQFIQSSLLDKKLVVETTPQKLSNGVEALLWKFDMPAMPEVSSTVAKAQLYLTVVSGDHIILLNGVVEGPIAESAVQKFLLATISTLKTSSKPINVKELQETIRKGNSQ